MTPVLEAARRYMAAGWAVFPVTGKVPANTHGVLEASTEERLAAIWFEKWPDRGLALATGVPSGVWVLDVDGPDAKEALVGLQAQHGSIPHTPASQTARGWHLFFRMPETGDIRNSAGKIAPGIDVRGTGGYVVLPPSPHPTGKGYRWLPGRAMGDVQPPVAPPWLLELVTTKADSGRPAGPIGDCIRAGGRNQTLTSLAGSMRRRGMSEEAILVALQTENVNRCVPPLDQEEVETIAGSVARYEPTTPPRVRTNGSHPNGKPENADVPPPLVQSVDWEVLRGIATEKEAPIDAVGTPWPTWNSVCYGAGGGEGLARGWHVIVGAASGTGKSITATNLAAYAIRAGHQVCMISLEMTRAEILTRLLAIVSGLTVRSLEHGRRFSRESWDAAGEILLERGGTFRVNDRPLHALLDIRQAIENEAKEGTRMVIVDYLQLAWVSNAETLYHQITEVSRTIQALAQEHKITTVGISQVNRRTSSGDGALKKEGLMGGSSLENDADQVVLLGFPERESDAFVSKVKLDKNRHGPAREWAVRMDPMNLQMHEVNGR